MEASMKSMEERFRKEQKTKEEQLRKDFAEKEIELKKEMWNKAQSAAKIKLDDEFKEKLVELQALRERDEKARARELEFLKEKQALESRQKDMEIEKERAIIAAKKDMEEQMRKEAQEKNLFELEKYKAEFERRLAEKEKQTDILKKALDDATMKANQGSMQIQGETQENALKQALQSEFPIDTIEDVPTGIKGADLVQTVRSSRGEEVGIIAWESKDAKAWSDSWAEKLKEDRLRVGASISVIVTTVLPQ